MFLQTFYSIKYYMLCLPSIHRNWLSECRITGITFVFLYPIFCPIKLGVSRQFSFSSWSSIWRSEYIQKNTMIDYTCTHERKKMFIPLVTLRINQFSKPHFPWGNVMWLLKWFEWDCAPQAHISEALAPTWWPGLGGFGVWAHFRQCVLESGLWELQDSCHFRFAVCCVLTS